VPGMEEEGAQLVKAAVEIWESHFLEHSKKGGIVAKSQHWKVAQEAIFPYKHKILTAIDTFLIQTEHPLSLSDLIDYGCNVLSVVAEAKMHTLLKKNPPVLKENRQELSTFSKRLSPCSLDHREVQRYQETLRQLFLSLEALCNGLQDKFNTRYDKFYATLVVVNQ